MTDAIATEVRNAAQYLVIDEFGRVWGLGHDEMMNADNRRDRDRLLELGAIIYDGPGYYHVAEGYASLFNRL